MLMLLLVCLGGLFVGSCLGVLLASLLYVARQNTEEYERGNRVMAVVVGDGGDSGGRDPVVH